MFFASEMFSNTNFKIYVVHWYCSVEKVKVLCLQSYVGVMKATFVCVGVQKYASPHTNQ